MSTSCLSPVQLDDLVIHRTLQNAATAQYPRDVDLSVGQSGDSLTKDLIAECKSSTILRRIRFAILRTIVAIPCSVRSSKLSNKQEPSGGSLAELPVGCVGYELRKRGIRARKQSSHISNVDGIQLNIGDVFRFVQRREGKSLGCKKTGKKERGKKRMEREHARKTKKENDR
ncbi:hypothetical protein K0M31_009476 [Melipona bicolor]|uniref:Uncharacterized protein n=1 Tax=Melipona bicolor TaxID=60889 RepID=A0AA40KJ22_9HYME|nr:hypothetical protein K0M31_009476 [Melipona bicolor]